MLTTYGRGKAYTNEVLDWSVYVHALDYIFTEKNEKEVLAMPPEVERVLRRVAKSSRATEQMLTMYSTARVYRLYYSADYEDKKTLLNELYEKANAVLAKTLKK